jgi:hypothetical protein
LNRVVRGFDLYGVEGVPGRTQTLALTPEGTSVVLARSPVVQPAGLRFTNPTDEASNARARVLSALLRAVALAGTPAPSAEQPIVVHFSGDAPVDPASLAPIKSGWMLGTVLRMRENPVLAQAGAGNPGASVDGQYVAVARDRAQNVRVRAATLGRELLVEISAPPDSLLSAATVRAALEARAGNAAQPEQEPARIPAMDLGALMKARPGAPVEQAAWRHAESTDGRWLWAAVLVLLGIEQWVRAKSTARVTEETRRAAA